MTQIKALLFLIVVLSVTGCEPEIKIPEASAGDADFTSYVAVGSSFTSGFADGALSKDGQLASYPNLLAQRFDEVTNGNLVFNIPLLKGDRGVYPDYDLSKSNPYKITESKLILVKKEDCKGEIAILPERLAESGDDEVDLNDPSQRIADGTVFHHLGVPAMKVSETYNPGLTEVNNYTNNKPFSPFFWRFAQETDLFYRYIDELKRTSPTFYTMEFGMNDILNYATDGGIGKQGFRDQDYPTPDAFERGLDSVLYYLQRNDAMGVMANIPDVSTFPHFTRIEYNDLDIEQDKADSLNAFYSGNTEVAAFSAGNNPFVVREDGVVRSIKPTERILLGIDVDSLKCYDLGAYYPIPDEYVLSEKELEIIRQKVDEFNLILTAKANERGVPLVDLKRMMDELEAGFPLSGIDLDSEFVSGGFFSLDGLHPNQRGQAIIANEFIKVINQHYNANIPLYDITSFTGAQFF